MRKTEEWISPPDQSFAGLPVSTQFHDVDADIAVIGLHYRSPYPPEPSTGAAHVETIPAADAIRRQAAIFEGHLNHYHFDFEDTLLAGKDVRIVDCGDVGKHFPGDRRMPDKITTAIRTLVERNVVPIALGTDEGNAIAVMRAYGGVGRLCVVHVDAHIDWRDQRDGVREGYSSVMRRASEMPWVKSMAQVGLRGIGSARQKEIDDALAFGSVFIRARDVHRSGIDACVNMIPAADHYLITIDADALDTAIAPGVLFTSPGGLTFDETTDLLRGLARKGKIVGLNLFEVRPEMDVNCLTATTAAHLIVYFLGVLAHTGQIASTPRPEISTGLKP